MVDTEAESTIVIDSSEFVVRYRYVVCDGSTIRGMNCRWLWNMESKRGSRSSKRRDDGEKGG